LFSLLDLFLLDNAACGKSFQVGRILFAANKSGLRKISRSAMIFLVLAGCGFASKMQQGVEKND